MKPIFAVEFELKDLFVFQVSVSHRHSAQQSSVQSESEFQFSEIVSSCEVSASTALRCVHVLLHETDLCTGVSHGKSRAKIPSSHSVRVNVSISKT